MPVIESPSDSRVQLQVDPTFGAARVSLRPVDVKSHGGAAGGHYRGAWSTGLTTGIAAGGALFSLRWSDPERVLLVHRIRVAAVVDTPFTAAQEVSVDLVRVRPFSVADTGGTPVVPGEALRAASAMRPFAVGDLRMATTAALTPGTGTEEEHPLEALVLGIGNAIGSAAAGILTEVLPGAGYPIELAGGEGLRLRNRFAQGAAGVVRFTFAFEFVAVPLAF